MARRGAKRGYERIVMPDGATCTTTALIDRLLNAKGLAVTPSNRELVRVIIRKYQGPRPITETELLEYLLPML